MATFARILAATDFSDASRRALALAAALAREAGAALTVVHVCEVPGYRDEGPIPYDFATPLVANAQARLDEALSALERECPGVKGVLKLGTPWQEILATVPEVRADLVVMGTQGRRGVAHALLGSVAERVLRLSPVPVLTVRARGGD
jgi:nucleotide-binding universal stress UspA family protein